MQNKYLVAKHDFMQPLGTSYFVVIEKKQRLNVLAKGINKM